MLSIGGFAIALLLYILHTPLVLTALLEKEGATISVKGTMGWGRTSIYMTWKGGSGTVALALQGKPVVEKVLSAHLLKSENPLEGREVHWSERELDLSSMGIGIQELKGLLFLFFRYLRVQTLSCSVILGFPTAWLTGRIYGYFWAIKSICKPFSWLSLDMTPSFHGSRIDGHVSFCVEVRYPLVFVVRMFQVLGVHSLLRLVSYRGDG